MSKPNIVIIQCDSMDGRVMGCMNHGSAYTPNLDRLCANGAIFRNMYTNSPQCVPSRASMFSGKHVHTIEGWNNFKGISETEPTFLSEFAENGYVTQTYGKTDYLSGHHTFGNRIHAWARGTGLKYYNEGPRTSLNDGETAHKVDWDSTYKSVEFINNAAKDRPFLLYCGINAPHPQFKTTKQWLDKIDAATVTLPPVEKELHPCIRLSAEQKSSLNLTDDEILDIRRYYYAMVAEVDAMAGTIIDALEKAGLADNTFVIFTSDHGEMSMEHSLWLKNSMYEASARVPFIVAGPGVKKGVAVNKPVSLIDLYPTIADMASIAPCYGLEGTSLFHAAAGASGAENALPDCVLSQYHSNFMDTGVFMIRSGSWKYVVYVGYEPQLFDLDADPDEINNLADKNPQKRNEMEALLRAAVDYEAVDRKAKALDEKMLAEWRSSVTPEEYDSVMKKYFDI